MSARAEAGNNSLCGGSIGPLVLPPDREAGSCSRRTQGSRLPPRRVPTEAIVRTRAIRMSVIWTYWVLSVSLLRWNRCGALILQRGRGPYEDHGARPPVVSEWLGVYG